MTTTPEGGTPRRRLRDSFVGNIIVIVVTTAIIVAGVWVVNALTGDSDSSATPSATASTAVSEVELTGDTSGAAPEIGKAAPDFTTFSTEGEAITLSELAGQPVWLIFGATWCSNCRAETPDIQAVHEDYGDEVAIVSVYVGESISTVADYAERLALTYPQVADAYTDIGSSYRVMGLPTHFFIDDAGVIQAIDIGTVTEAKAAERLDSLLGR